MNNEDLNEIERAGRRCAVCHSGRGWRRFEVLRAAEHEPIVLCASCKARYGDDPPVARKPVAVAAPEPAARARARARNVQRGGASPGPASPEPNPDRIASARPWANYPARSRRRWPPEPPASTKTRRSPDCRTSSGAARSGATVTAGRPRLPPPTSPQRSIGSRPARPTSGSSERRRASADRPPRMGHPRTVARAWTSSRSRQLACSTRSTSVRSRSSSAGCMTATSCSRLCAA